MFIVLVVSSVTNSNLLKQLYTRFYRVTLYSGYIALVLRHLDQRCAVKRLIAFSND